MRVRELDGIRGLAVLMVVVYHSGIWGLPPTAFHGFLSRIIRLVFQLTRPGWLGVDLFFVLSGFLITSILLAERTSLRYYRTFYMRRVLRIVPLYYVLLAVLWLAFRHSTAYIALAAVSLANFAPLMGVAVIYNPLWSLCVEEHFYLLWPTVIRKVKIQYLISICVAICALEPFVRLAGWLAKTDTSYVTWFRLEGLASGALIAILAHQRGNSSDQFLRWSKRFLLIGTTILVLGLPFGITSRGTATNAALQVTYADFLFAGVVSFVLARKSKILERLLLFNFLVLCGDLSYCLYLIHLLIFWTWDGTAAVLPALANLSVVQAATLRLVVCFSVALAVAYVSRIWFELPILSLKRRFEYDRESSLQIRLVPPAMGTEDDTVAPPGASLPN